MLKGISPILPPDLLKILMEMGHGDTLVIGDGNFPAASCARRLVRCDGHTVCAVLEAILALFPLDSIDNHPLAVMQTADGSQPPVWSRFEDIVRQEEGEVSLLALERFAFYEQAKAAYAIVSTGDLALFANIIIKKGVCTTSN